MTTNVSNSRYVVIVTIILFAGIIFVWLSNLKSDAPYTISVGQELSTDPPQYTSFARNKILFDKWEIYETRYVLFVYNVTTFLSYVVFKILGSGRAQANLVAVILSLVVVISLFLTSFKKGVWVALSTTAILGFNYVFLSYGKQPFLELSMLCMVSLGGYFLLRDRNRLFSASLSGVLFASAAFFSKLTGIIFFPISIVILLIELHDNQYRLLKKLNPLYAYLTGYISILVIWLIVIYFQNDREISGYLSEISTGMYGTPRAFESLKMFIVQLFSYGFDIKLWLNQPLTFITGFLGVGVVAGMMFSFPKYIVKNINKVDLFYLMWFISAYITLFPWNYRPLRYALLILPPLSYFSARWILLLMYNKEKFGSRAWPYYMLIGLSGSYVAFNLLTIPYFNIRSLAVYTKFIPYGILFGIIISIVGWVFHKTRIKDLILSKSNWPIGSIIAVSLVLFSVSLQLRSYYSHAVKGQHSIYNASKDLGKILSPNAVVIGSYSSALTQENKLKSAIKMFGVPVVERGYFEKIPATHVAIESGEGPTSQKGRAFRDYPDVMNGSVIITTYYLRGYPVDVYLLQRSISEYSGNPYKPSNYEKAAIYLNEGVVDSASYYLNKFENEFGESISTISMKMRISLKIGSIEKAIAHLEKLASLEKGNINTWLYLGELYVKSKPILTNKAIWAYKNALYLKPDDLEIKERISILEKFL